MIHIHKKQCDSTQEMAIGLVEEGNENILVSCEEQVKGAGQRGRAWISSDQCLALSFDIWPADIRSLTSLEIAVLAKQFIRKEFKKEIYLKWPNDLYTESRRKCGGILMQGQSDYLVVGLGLNLFLKEENIPKNLKGKISGIFSDKQKADIELLSLKLYRFITENRIPSNLIRDLWLKSCFHFNERVEILEMGNEETGIRGVFSGLGDQGQCLLKTEKGVAEFFSASLIIDP